MSSVAPCCACGGSCPPRAAVHNRACGRRSHNCTGAPLHTLASFLKSLSNDVRNGESPPARASDLGASMWTVAFRTVLSHAEASQSHSSAACRRNRAVLPGDRKAAEVVCAAVYRFCLEYEKMPSTTVAGRRPNMRTREGDAPP